MTAAPTASSEAIARPKQLPQTPTSASSNNNTMMELKLQLLEKKAAILSKEIERSVREERRLLAKLQSSKSVYQAMRDCGYLHTKTYTVKNTTKELSSVDKPLVCQENRASSPPPDKTETSNTTSCDEDDNKANSQFTTTVTERTTESSRDGPPAFVIIDHKSSLLLDSKANTRQRLSFIPSAATSPLGEDELSPIKRSATNGKSHGMGRPMTRNLSVPNLITIATDSRQGKESTMEDISSINKENSSAIPGRRVGAPSSSASCCLRDVRKSKETDSSATAWSSSFAAVKFEHRLRQFQNAETANASHPPPLYKLPAPKILHTGQEGYANSMKKTTALLPQEELSSSGRRNPTKPTTTCVAHEWHFIWKEAPTEESKSDTSSETIQLMCNKQPRVSAADVVPLGKANTSPGNDTTTSQQEYGERESEKTRSLTPERRSELRKLVCAQQTKIRTLLEQSRKNGCSVMKTTSEQEDSLGSI